MPRGATNETMNVLREKFDNPAQWTADLKAQERCCQPREKQGIGDTVREWLSGPHL